MTNEEVVNFKKMAWQSKEAAEVYNKGVQPNLYFNLIEFPLYMDYIKETDSVFDMAAGTGILTLYLADRVRKVVASDISKEMLFYIEQQKKPNVSIFHVDSDTCDFSKVGKFDVVTSHWFMPHYAKWEHFLAQKKQLCKKNGYIIFDLLSKDNMLLAKKDIIQVKKALGYSEHAVGVSETELKEACDRLNLEVVKLIPTSFIASNGLFLSELTFDEYVSYRECVEKLYHNPIFMDFIQKFEKTIVQSSNIATSLKYIAVLQNKG